MRKFLYVIVIVFLLCAVAEASWRMNPHTRKLDYYESASGGGADAVAGIVVYGWRGKFAAGYVVMYKGEVVYYGGP